MSGHSGKAGEDEARAAQPAVTLVSRTPRTTGTIWYRAPMTIGAMNPSAVTWTTARRRFPKRPPVRGEGSTSRSAQTRGRRSRPAMKCVTTRRNGGAS